MTADIPRIPFDILDRTLAQNPYIPHIPWPKQLEFLELECMDALFGGAGSGGKSDALLMAALMFAQVPGYSALIVRRNFTDLKLPGGLIDRSIDWLQKKAGAKWNAQENRWRFREGSTLQFGYADKEGDEQRYHGAEFQFCGIDESCQFTERQLKFFFERLRRRSEITVPLRMRLATTPGGVGHQYIYKRYVNPGTPGKAYIAATIHDNAAVDKEQYITSLAELDPIRRRQMLDGDWEAVEGGLIKREWFGWWRPVPELPGTAVLTNNTGIELERFRLDHCARFQTCDPAASTSAISDYFVLSTWAVTPKANVVWIGCHRGKYEIADQVGVCQRLYRRYHPQFLAVEEVLNQRALAQLLRRSTQPVMAVRAVSPQGRDKLNRAAGFIALAASGRVFVPERSHPQDFDTEEVMGELVRFTGEDKRSAHDDVCLTGDTIVETTAGPKPIREVKVGEFVHTRSGPRRVTWSGMTSEYAAVESVRFSNGSTLTGTASHPVFVHGKGFVRLDSICYGDRIEAWENQQPSASSSTGAATSDTPTPSGASTASTSSATTSGKRPPVTCTATFGSSTTARSRTATRFTTRTGTRSTTTQLTSCASRTRNTAASTPNAAPTRPQRFSPTLIAFVPSRSRGTAAPRAASGTARTPSGRPKSVSKFQSCASSAAKSSWRSPGTPPCVAAPALKCSAAPRRQTTSTGPVSHAGPCSGSTSTRSRKPAPHRANRREAVYNLTVEGASEFFANGVLVHNCDTCSYMHQMLPFVRSAGLTASRPFTIHESKSGPFSGLT